MANQSAITSGFPNSGRNDPGLSLAHIGAVNAAIIATIKDIYASDTVKTLATWLRLTLKTAKNRIDNERQFSLDEVGELLGSDHGFKILTKIMEAAAKRPGYRVPSWWAVCEPLMDLADAELLCAAVRRRTDRVIRKREDVADALETEIRRAQAVAIHGPGPARAHADALRSIAGDNGRVVAAKRKR